MPVVQAQQDVVPNARLGQPGARVGKRGVDSVEVAAPVRSLLEVAVQAGHPPLAAVDVDGRHPSRNADGRTEVQEMFSHLALITPIRCSLSFRSRALSSFQLVLVAQPLPAEELHVHARGRADEPQLLGAHPGANLHVPASDEERVQRAVGLVELRRVGEVFDLVQHLHLQLLGPCAAAG